MVVHVPRRTRQLVLAGAVVAVGVGGTGPLWWPDGDDAKTALVVVTVTRLGNVTRSIRNARRCRLAGARVTLAQSAASHTWTQPMIG